MRTSKGLPPAPDHQPSPRTGESSLDKRTRGGSTHGGVRKTSSYLVSGRLEWTVFSIRHTRYFLFLHRGSRGRETLRDSHRGS